ncbi:MAG: Stp1/IreP family PP2C-type Ser/Thr phosphatase [Myxococcota bacterium]|nr:Stp1/IreP family PP2C-type Ser/Thr phosphatase [Myxococcota bacterium]
MPSSAGPDKSSLIDVRNCEVASQSDIGLVRSQNQDSCAALERSDGARLLIVADGMGGHLGGETASRLTVEALSSAFETASSDGESPFSSHWLDDAIRAANREVHTAAQANPELRGMGTTVVCVLIDVDGRAFVSHAGDSRLYRARDGNLERITEDHSVVAEMQRRGLLTEIEAAAHPRRNEIVRSVGVGGEVTPDTTELDLQPGDEVLLCSDGLCGVLDDPAIAAVLNEGREAGYPAGHIVAEWIARANDAGGPDNITAQLLRTPVEPLTVKPTPTEAGGSFAALGMLGLLVIGLALFAWILWN